MCVTAYGGVLHFPSFNFYEIDFSKSLFSFHKKQEEWQLLFLFALKTHKTIKQL